MKKLFQILACAAVICSMTVACEKSPEAGGEGPSGGDKTPLATPVLSLSRQTGTSVRVSWDLVEGAGMYAYEVNGKGANTAENFVDVTGLSVDVAATIRVRAIAADTKKYSDSEWAEITYTPVRFSMELSLPAEPYMQVSQFNGIYVTLSGTDVKGIKYVLFPYSEANTDSEIEAIVKQEGFSLPEASIQMINDGGEELTFNYLASNHTYTVACVATFTDNTTEYVRKDITTADYGSGEPTEVYNKFIGYYEITSTDSEILNSTTDQRENRGPQTFTIEVFENIANGLYWYTWYFGEDGFTFAYTGYLGSMPDKTDIMLLGNSDILMEDSDGYFFTLVTKCTATNVANPSDIRTLLFSVATDENPYGMGIYFDESGNPAIFAPYSTEPVEVEGKQYNFVVDRLDVTATNDFKQFYGFYDLLVPIGPFTVRTVEAPTNAPAMVGLHLQMKEAVQQPAFSTAISDFGMSKCF